MGHVPEITLDTIRTGNRGSVPLFSLVSLVRRDSFNVHRRQDELTLHEVTMYDSEGMPAVRSRSGHGSLWAARPACQMHLQRRDLTTDAGWMKPKVARANWAKTGAGEKAGVMAGVMTGAMTVAMADVIAGAMTGAIAGAIAGAVAGAVTGAMTGTVTGAVAGAMAGAVTDAIAGAIAGAITGAIAGAVAGAIAGVMARAMMGAAAGPMTGAMAGATIPPTGVSFPASGD